MAKTKVNNPDMSCSEEIDPEMSAPCMTKPALISRRSFLFVSASVLATPLITGRALAASVMQVWKSPTCGCCAAWVEHVEASGFTVKVTETDAMAAVKTRLGVPPELQSCHTALIDGYTIEGHVPANDIHTLLKSRPENGGLAVPGMPIGSPGMEMGERRDPFQVIRFGQEGFSVFSEHNL